MSRGNSRKLTRGQSSNSLKPGARGGKGLNPEALFSVAAMATAPVGTTVIEDDEDSIIEESEFSAKDFLDAKDAGIGVLEHPLDARHLDNQHSGQADFDLCTQCTKKRERARQQRRSFKNEDQHQKTTPKTSHEVSGKASSSFVVSRNSNASFTSSSSSNVNRDGRELRPVPAEGGEEAANYSKEDPDEAAEAGEATTVMENLESTTLTTLPTPKVPPPRPPRTRAPSIKKKYKPKASTASTQSNQSQGISEEIATAVFSITPNPIVNEINENANPANAATSSLTVVPVKILPDYCPPAEDAPCGQMWDATSSVVTPPEVALLQKRIQFRRMLPCLDFEDLERKRMEMDESSYLIEARLIEAERKRMEMLDDTRLEMVDSRLAEAHRVVMQRTANRYLVMEAATFGDKLFTGTLIFLTILAILVLFAVRNFGHGLLLLKHETYEHSGNYN